MDKPKRQTRQFNRDVKKATKIINRGGINFEEDYNSNVANMDPAMRAAFLKSSQGQDFVNAKMSDTKNKNEDTARELMDMKKKGGISTKGKAFFNPGLSKRKK